MSNVTAQMQAIYDQFKAIEPGVELGGIYANKPGYHNSRRGNSSSNYSVAQFAVDREGPDDAAAAIDLTFPSAQHGDYSKIAVYSNRLYAAGKANDPRTTYLREFFGQTDSDGHVEGYDFTKESDSSSDSSHLWHIHISVHRKYVEDPEMVRAVLSILKGETVEQWRSGGGSWPAPANPTPSRPSYWIDEDGELGPNTVRRWQQYMGTPQDGVISNVSMLVKAVQKYLNAKIGARLSVDGWLGPNTVRALQRYLGTTQDGVVSRPKSQMVLALQKRLNTNSF